MKIGEVARLADVHAQTLRYYERRGLLPAPKRRPSGYREYSAEAVHLVRFIKRAQELGFSLRDVGELIELRQHPAQNCPRVRDAARRKVADIDDKIRQLTAMKLALESLTSTCQAGEGCCPVIDALNEDPADTLLAAATS